jgi:hypothetical protein
MLWRLRCMWLMAPDEGGGAAGGGSLAGGSPAVASIPAPPAPAASSGGAPAASAPSPSGGGSAGQTAGGAAQAAAQAAQGGQAAQQWTGVRDALASLGVDLRNQFQDDQGALAHLAVAYRQSQQMQPFVPYLQQYAQYGEQFQAWLRQQQAAQQQPVQQAWKPPEFDPRWVNMIQRNTITGQLEPAAGAPPDIVQKYQAAEAHRRGFLEKLPFDPLGALKEVGIEGMIQQAAQRIVQEQLGGYQQQQQAQSFIAENTGWLHQRDQQGQVVRDPMTGRQQLSEWGQRFAGYLGQYEKLYPAAAAQNMALTAIQRDFLYAQQQAAAAPGAAAAAGQTANEQFLQQAATRQPNNALAAPGQPTQQPKRGIKEMLTAAMKANGYNGDTVLTTTR